MTDRLEWHGTQRQWKRLSERAGLSYDVFLKGEKGHMDFFLCILVDDDEATFYDRDGRLLQTVPKETFPETYNEITRILKAEAEERRRAMTEKSTEKHCGVCLHLEGGSFHPPYCNAGYDHRRFVGDARDCPSFKSCWTGEAKTHDLP